MSISINRIENFGWIPQRSTYFHPWTCQNLPKVFFLNYWKFLIILFRNKDLYAIVIYPSSPLLSIHFLTPHSNSCYSNCKNLEFKRWKRAYWNHQFPCWRWKNHRSFRLLGRSNYLPLQYSSIHPHIRVPLFSFQSLPIKIPFILSNLNRE